MKDFTHKNPPPWCIRDNIKCTNCEEYKSTLNYRRYRCTIGKGGNRGQKTCRTYQASTERN